MHSEAAEGEPPVQQIGESNPSSQARGISGNERNTSGIDSAADDAVV
jgi:hypothetical protein